MPLSPLPIDQVLPSLLTAVSKAGAAVLKAPTGAGKTTRVPVAVSDALRKANVPGQVIVLEPRRVAARAAARRMSSERGTRLGEEVGYQVRFERKASKDTRVLVVTEGVFLRMLQADPFLEKVAAVLFDEFHERSLFSDLALALAQRVRGSVKEDLKIVVMSATLTPSPVATFLGDAPVIESEGRLFPVEVEHSPSAPETPLEKSVRSVVLRVVKEGDGDVLVFLPGVGEITRCAKLLAEDARALDVEILPLHGELPPERQDAALVEGGRRKVILATNVAETSLTIPGVRVVVDAGLERVPRVDPAVGLERLETVRISRESADQRAGRAGRTGPGRCVRLWSQSEDAHLAPRRLPEVQRADLAGAALQLHAWGESDLRAFPWFEAPPEHALESAETLLTRLGALVDGRLTEAGRLMADVPAHPRLARLLVAAHEFGHGRRLALAAALLSERSPFVPLRRGEEVEHASLSDVLDAVEALEAFERNGRLDAGPRPLRRGAAHHALRAAKQLARVVGSSSSDGDADKAVLKAVLAAYADRLARRRIRKGDRAVMVGGRGVRLGSGSAVRDAELFACVDVDAGRRGERSEAWVRSASGVERAWLDPTRVRTTETLSFDPKRECVRGVRQVCFDDLVLEEVEKQVGRGADVAAVLEAAARDDLGAALALQGKGLAAFRARVACLKSWRPELDLPAIDEETLAALLPELCRGKRSFEELRQAPLLDHVRGHFTWEQMQTLQREAPEEIEVPSGSRIRLLYEEGRPPVLAVRIQEVFGMRETPTVASGRVKVLMHLLAPNQRPQQITDDMPSFWKNTYPYVRAELRRRYAKHAWPEDPLRASPEHRPQRRPRR
jgi:ATP-dependent helicase HrpB